MHMDRYDMQSALKPILPFIDDASNWYVRRSRKRFWRPANQSNSSSDDADKAMAYQTLHYVLVQLAHVMAPFTPFLAEELYRNITSGESVHLNDWPVAGHVNELILEHMNIARAVINEGLSQRAQAGIKVRQPLSKVHVLGASNLNHELTEIIAEELNIKEVVLYSQSPKVQAEQSFLQVLEAAKGSLPFMDLKVVIDLEITAELKREGLMREVIRSVQAARKEADLQVDDRIELGLHTENKELAEAITEHAKIIESETLAVSILKNVDDGFAKTLKVEGAELVITLKKA